MKLLSRRFTTREKVLLTVFAVILVILLYWQAVDTPVRDTIAEAQSEQESLTMEYTALSAKLASLEKMKNELDTLVNDKSVSVMASYNNAAAEINLINDALSETESYSVTFTGVTRYGNQIRRNVTISFGASSYEQIRRVLTTLQNSHDRCLIGNVSCSVSYNGELYQVTVTATFFETMVGGTADSGLPADSAAAAAASSEAED